MGYSKNVEDPQKFVIINIKFSFTSSYVSLNICTEWACLLLIPLILYLTSK